MMNRIAIAVCLIAVMLGRLAEAETAPTYKELQVPPSRDPLLQTTAIEIFRSPTVFDIAVQRDSDQLVVAKMDGKITRRSLHDADNSALITETKGQPACAVLSRHGQLLAYADQQNRVALVPLAGQQIRMEDNTEPDRTVSLQFSTDGNYLAGVTVAGVVRIWDTATGQLIQRQPGVAGPVQSIAFSTKGDRIALAAYGHNVRLLDTLPAGDAIAKVIRVGPTRITALAFVPNADQLVVASSDGAVRLINTENGRAARVIGSYPYAVWSLEFDPAGKRLAAGSWDGTIKLWNVADWKPIQSVKTHEESVTALAFHPDGSLVSAGLDGRLLAWHPDVPSIASPAMIAGRNSSVWVATYSPDGNRLFVGGHEKRFELWDMETHSLIVSRDSHPTTRCATFSPSGEFVATGGSNGLISLCDAKTGGLLRTFERHPGALSAIAFTDEGRTLISGCDGGVVKLWDTHSGEELATWKKHRQQVYCAAVSPDQRWLITGGGNWTTGDAGELFVWDLQSRALHKRLRGHSLAVWSIVFSPSGDWFASSDSSGAVRVWDTNRLKHVRTLQHSTWVRALALSPSGETLAVGRGDGSLRLWDTMLWEQRASCDGHDGFSFFLQYHPAGDALASSGQDGTVRFWPAGP